MTHITHVQTSTGWEVISSKPKTELFYIGTCATDGDLFMSKTASGDINIYKGKTSEKTIFSIFRRVKRFVVAKEISILPILKEMQYEAEVRAKQCRYSSEEFFRMDERKNFIQNLIRIINL